MHLPGTHRARPALPCRAAHPLLPALTSLQGRGGDHLFLPPWRAGVGRTGGSWGVRLQGESSLPAESEKMHLGPFPPSQGWLLSFWDWVEYHGTRPAEAGSTQPPRQAGGRAGDQPWPTEGRSWGTGGAVPAPRTTLSGPWLCSEPRFLATASVSSLLSQNPAGDSPGALGHPGSRCQVGRDSRRPDVANEAH